MPSDQNRIYFIPLCFVLGVMSLSLVPVHAQAGQSVKAGPTTSNAALLYRMVECHRGAQE